MNLSGLIAATKGDRSYEALAKASGDALGSQRWQQLATRPIKNFPDPPTIYGISQALQVTPVTVILAAAESLGFAVPNQQSRLATLLPPAVEWLDDEQIAAVRAVVLALLRDVDGRLSSQAEVTALHTRRSTTSAETASGENPRAVRPAARVGDPENSPDDDMEGR